jgi:general L-amino acid transport system permease protein
MMGLDNDWAVKAIKAAGNYGEIFEATSASRHPDRPRARPERAVDPGRPALRPAVPLRTEDRGGAGMRGVRPGSLPTARTSSERRPGADQPAAGVHPGRGPSAPVASQVEDDHGGDVGTRAAGLPPLELLIYDARYRSLTIQVVAFLLFIFAIGWLVNNAVENLAALGKTFSFRFLGQPAGYDINQRLIEYTSRSTHGRAAMVGMLNTLLVAFLGCIWRRSSASSPASCGCRRTGSSARIMTVYVEVFRNIPVLIQILLIYAVMTELLPAPNAFRGDDPTASHGLWDTVAVTNRGVYVPEPDLGARARWVVASPSSPRSIGASGSAATPRRGSYATGESCPAVPHPSSPSSDPADRLLVFWIRARPADGDRRLPELRGFNFQGGIHLRNSLIALWLALSIYTGAFIAENVRAGILRSPAARPRPPSRSASRPGGPCAS